MSGKFATKSSRRHLVVSRSAVFPRGRRSPPVGWGKGRREGESGGQAEAARPTPSGQGRPSVREREGLTVESSPLSSAFLAKNQRSTPLSLRPSKQQTGPDYTDILRYGACRASADPRCRCGLSDGLAGGCEEGYRGLSRMMGASFLEIDLWRL